MKSFFLSILFALCSFSSYAVEEVASDSIPPHPRLLMHRQDEVNIKKMLKQKTNRFLLEVHYQCISIADQTLNEPVAKWPGEGHILSTSRNVLRRVVNLCYAYRMTGYFAYAKRAEEEMLNACAFPHWDPPHFLDTAEMMFAISIGYDWLYDFLSESSRKIIEEAVLRNAFLVEDRYKSRNATNNWNSVCNSGLVAASAAFCDIYPQQAKKHVDAAFTFNPIVLGNYAPDGAYPEGYTYWSYGTGYQVLMVDILEQVFGGSNGLTEYPGFMNTGYFIQFMTSPTGHCFSFADSGDRQIANLFVFWFAARNNDPSLAFLEKKLLDKGDVYYGIEDRFLPFMLLYASRIDFSKMTAPKRNVWTNGGELPMFIYRSGWESPEDTYLCVKGGKPNLSHGHMDNGSFYFEKGGVIWAKDMGGQSYGTFYKNNVSCWDFSQDGDRWGIWRYCTQMHNTLTINDSRHNAAGFAPIEAVFDTESMRGCSVNLDSTFCFQLESARRRVFLTDLDSTLVIEDSLAAKVGVDADIYWNMVTCADAAVDGPNSIALTKSKHQMLLKVECPVEVEMTIQSTKSPFSWDVSNPGTCRVGFRTKLPAGQTMKTTVKLIYVK